jgi:hypothetical protein
MTKLSRDYRIFPNRIAEGTIPARRFVKKGSAVNGVVLCGAGEDAMGVSDVDLRMQTAAGASRTGFVQYEQIPIIRKGVAIVEAGGAVSAGARVKSDAAGKAVAYTDPTISSTPTQAEVTAVRDAYKTCKGRALTAATQDTDLIEVDLEDRA